MMATVPKWQLAVLPGHRRSLLEALAVAFSVDLASRVWGGKCRVARVGYARGGKSAQQITRVTVALTFLHGRFPTSVGTGGALKSALDVRLRPREEGRSVPRRL